MLRLLIPLLLMAASAALAGPEMNDARARFNYQLMCQGCHTPDGSGGYGVPGLKGFVGNFLRSAEGREYLVRVPGSANSTLSDTELAEVLNWIIVEFGGDSVPDEWRPYAAGEVGNYRSEPLLEVLNHRLRLLAEISAANGG